MSNHGEIRVVVQNWWLVILQTRFIPYELSVLGILKGPVTERHFYFKLLKGHKKNSALHIDSTFDLEKCQST